MSHADEFAALLDRALTTSQGDSSKKLQLLQAAQEMCLHRDPSLLKDGIGAFFCLLGLSLFRTQMIGSSNGSVFVHARARA